MESAFTVDFVFDILTAVGLGALFGVERAHKSEPPSQAVENTLESSGLRTYSVIALLGFCAAFLSEKWGNGLLLLCLFLVGSLILASYWQEAQKYNFLGVTSEFSEMLVFLIGATVFWDKKIAILITAVTLWILALKKPLRAFSKKISPEELKAILKFIIVAFVVLPLLPTEAIDPWGVIVPYKAWLMVIFISGLSFLGYALTKIIGPEKGIEITGLVGGLASSTATTSSMAQGSRKNSRLVSPFVFAVIAASSIMFVRIGFTVFVINARLFKILLGPLALIVFTCLLVLGVLFWRSKKHKKTKTEPLSLQSPFQLKPALLFGLFYIFILLVAHFMHEFFGKQGLLLASGVAGITDVDAITLSLSELTKNQEITDIVATQGILIAALVNTTVKLFMARIFGGQDFAKMTTRAFGIILLAGGAAVALLWAFY